MRRRAPSRDGFKLFHDKHDPILLNQLKRFHEVMVANVQTMRRTASAGVDDRRSIEDECGYPKAEATLEPEKFRDMYRSNPIAARVVEVMPKESMQISPEVYEAERGQVVTPFELAKRKVAKDLRSEGCESYYEEETGNALDEYILSADLAAGIGQFGVVLFGIDDGLDLKVAAKGIKEEGTYPGDPALGEDGQPIKSNGQLTFHNARSERYRIVNNAAYESKDGELLEGEGDGPGRRLLYVRVFPEHLAKPAKYETNKRSPRYGQPTSYNISFNDPYQQSQYQGVTYSSQEVHWTRVLHVADDWHTFSPSKVFAVQRMRPVWNRLHALDLIYGADGESFWRNAIMKLFFETHPQLGGDVQVDEDEFRDWVEEMMNGLQQWGLLKGMSAKAIGPQVVDPTPHINAQIEAICIKIGVPKRVFMGSERGELASSQDDAAWNDRLKLRQNTYLSPRVVAPFYNRLIMLGVLPRPKRFLIWWPDIASQTDQEKAAVAVGRINALVASIPAIQAGLVMPFDVLTRFLPFSDQEANAILEASGLEDADEEEVEEELKDDADAEPDRRSQAAQDQSAAAGPDADAATQRSAPGAAPQAV